MRRLPVDNPRGRLCLRELRIANRVELFCNIATRYSGGWDAIWRGRARWWCAILGAHGILTCDHENRDVKDLASKVVRKVDKWDDMRHRGRLPASRENCKSWEAGGTAVGDEAHLQQAGIGSCARPREEEVQGGDSQRSARFFLALQWCPTELPIVATAAAAASSSMAPLSRATGREESLRGTRTEFHAGQVQEKVRCKRSHTLSALKRT